MDGSALTAASAIARKALFDGAVQVTSISPGVDQSAAGD
jgi:hypothetical protein